MRRLVTAGVAVAAMTLGLVGLGSVAVAASAPVVLTLSQGQAFTILGASCGGIQESGYATGFDPTTGYPVGVVTLSTTCSTGGRGSLPHTYTGSADVNWDFTGATVSATSPAARPAPPSPFSAVDGNGNQVYNSGNSAFLLLAPGFVPTPRVTAISANTGPSTGGTPVVITGTGFTVATGVNFGGTPAASFVITGDTSITAVAPVAPPGPVDVTVTSAGGTDAIGTFDLFTFVARPTITSLSPASGPLQGGNQVIVTGTNLAGVTSVSFGGNPSFPSAQSDTSLTVTAPAGDAIDTTTVTVTSIGGTAGATYAYRAPDLCGGGCVFTSPSTATATTGVPFSFTVSAAGVVSPTFKRSGTLPKGLRFVNNGNGTASLSGIPVNSLTRLAAGSYRNKISATFSFTPSGGGTVSKTITQVFTLTVR
jgi:hypothetical protein